jgi:hypothetical protein
MMECSHSPLGALVRGAVSGALGTLAMDVGQYARYRAGGGDQRFMAWEFAGVTSFDGAPAPAQIGKRITEALTQHELSDAVAGRVNNIMHWGYGIAWSCARGLLAGSRRRPIRAAATPLFGALVFASDYTVLPVTGLYKPIWEYDAKTLGTDLADHLVYGTASGIALKAMSRRR